MRPTSILLSLILSSVGRILSLQNGPASRPAASVNGAVVDSANRSVSNANIILSRYNDSGRVELGRAKTDGRGNFAIRYEGEAGIDPPATLEASADGFAACWISGFEAPAVGDLRIGTLQLPPAIPVSGIITNPNGTPVRDATIFTSPHRGTEKETVIDFSNAAATTDESGKFVLKNLGPGSYYILAAAPGMTRAVESLTLTSGDAKALSLQMNPTESFVASVCDPSGAPIDGADVRVAYQNLYPNLPRGNFIIWLGPPSTTDSKGRVSRSDVAPGDIVCIYKKGFLREPFVASAGTNPVKLRPVPPLIAAAPIDPKDKFDLKNIARVLVYHYGPQWLFQWNDVPIRNIQIETGGSLKITGFEAEPRRIAIIHNDGTARRATRVDPPTEKNPTYRAELNTPWRAESGFARNLYITDHEGKPISNTSIYGHEMGFVCGNGSALLEMNPIQDFFPTETEPGGEFRGFTTNADGMIQIQGGMAGFFEILTIKSNLGSMDTFSYAIPADTHISLPKTVTLRGMITIDGRPPATPVAVRASSYETTMDPIFQLTNPDGSFTLERIPIGEIDIDIHRSSDTPRTYIDLSHQYFNYERWRRSKKVNISEAPAEPVIIKLESSKRMTLRGIVRSGGRPVPFASVRLIARDDSANSFFYYYTADDARETITSFDGSFTLETNITDSLQLVVAAEEIRQRYEIDVAEFQKGNCILELTSAGAGGQILDANGAVAGVKMEIYSVDLNDTNGKEVPINAGGFFTLPKLTSGNYKFILTDPSGRHARVERRFVVGTTDVDLGKIVLERRVPFTVTIDGYDEIYNFGDVQVEPAGTPPLMAAFWERDFAKFPLEKNCIYKIRVPGTPDHYIRAKLQINGGEWNETTLESVVIGNHPKVYYQFSLTVPGDATEISLKLRVEAAPAQK